LEPLDRVSACERIVSLAPGAPLPATLAELCGDFHLALTAALALERLALEIEARRALGIALGYTGDRAPRRREEEALM
jgi:hypothetical protein